MEGIPPAACHCETHSCAHFEKLERDTRVAAELGQALLVRHEAYVASAEEDRRRILGSVQGLEADKARLELGNADLVEENRALLDRLESLSTALAESEAQVASLTATLHSTQDQLRRVTALAARTESLEKQLATLEIEQASLQDLLVTSKADERGAALRARQAERTISSLQDEIERIEHEAREDKQRHNDVVERMERRRAVERELETAAGRLKGAAAAKASNGNGGNHVVSHFVKDILQDNANLQLGIVELREMLFNSNEEVARLREQLLLHPPEMDDGKDGRLARELSMETPQSREVHVHHHFHEPARKDGEGARKHPSTQRRVRRKKNVSLASAYASPAPAARHTPTSAAAILAQTSVSIPTKSASQRWSMQSNQTGTTNISSVPSSPYAHSRRTSSIFERVFSDAGHDDSSLATSPDFSELGSPAFAPYKQPGNPFLQNHRSVSDPVAAQISSSVPNHSVGGFGDQFVEDDAEWHLTPKAEPLSHNDTILEEDLADEDATPTLSKHALPDEEADDIFTPSRLRRAASHESLISVSGMDIHTLQSRPSQLLHSRFLLGPSAAAAPSVSLSASKPVATATLATASFGSIAAPRASSGGAAHSAAILGNMVGARRRQSGDAVGQTGYGAGLATLGRSVGGWVKGSWGLAPTSTNGPAERVEQRSVPSSSTTTATTASRPRPVPHHTTPATTSPQHPRIKPMKSTPSLPLAGGETAPNARLTEVFRAPGINQPGAIFGLGPAPPAPSRTVVEPGRLDEEALREGLGLGGGAASSSSA